VARVRSGARYAPRFNEQYGEGFQFRPPQLFGFSFGPWDSIMPKGERDLPRTSLKTMNDGLLDDGMLKAAWSKEVLPFSNRKLLGAYEFELSQLAYHTIFWIDIVTGFLHVGFTAVSVSYDYVTTLTPLGTPIVAVPWQNELYFTSTELGGVYKIDINTGTVTLIPGTVGYEFLLMIDNNLVGIFKNAGLYYQVEWSVDGDPADWTGYGAGSNPLPNAMGAVKGFELLSDSGVILGASSAVRMVPTGFVPAFRFDDLRGYDGTPHNSTTSDGEYVYYVNYNGKLLRYDMAQSSPVGGGEDAFVSTPKIYFSRRLNRVVVSTSNPLCTLFLDPDNGRWNSTLDDNWTYMADSPRNGGLIGSIILYEVAAESYIITILQRITAGYLQPEFTTGTIRFPTPVHIFWLDIVYAVLPNSVALPIATVAYTAEDGSNLSVDAVVERRPDNIERIWLDIPVWTLTLVVTRDLVDPPPIWSFDTAIERIDVAGRSLTNEPVTFT
jgi:hypothetical protein